MIESATITNDMGASILLEMGNPDSSGISIRSITGLGPPKATVNTMKVSTADGVKINSASVDGRNIVFKLGFERALDVAEARERTYVYFPIRRRVKVTLKSNRRLVSVYGTVESNEPDVFSEDVTSTISILCEDAFFTDASPEGLVSTPFYAVEKYFEFPMENRSLTEKKIELGRIQTVFEKSITYKGDISVGLTMTVTATGDVGDLTIFNPDRNESFIIKSTVIQEMTGQGIMAGDTIVINTRTNQKVVTLIRSGVKYNVMKARDRSSTWLRLFKGSNKFGYAASYGSTNLQLVIESQTLYEGI